VKFGVEEYGIGSLLYAKFGMTGKGQWIPEISKFNI